MMYTITQDGTSLYVKVMGHLDIKSSPVLEEALEARLGGIDDLTLDFAGVDYVSSMGLRLLLALQKRMDKQGKMRVTKVDGSVKELFDDSGFSEILTIE